MFFVYGGFVLSRGRTGDGESENKARKGCSAYAVFFYRNRFEYVLIGYA